MENDPEFAAYRPDAKKAGFRSVQSTPFFTKDGNVLGMVSTHFAHAHEPTPIEMQTLKKYSIVAAEHLNKLLGNVPLAIKAKQMSEELYTRTLGKQGFAAEPRSPGISTSKRANPSSSGVYRPMGKRVRFAGRIQRRFSARARAAAAA